MQRKNQTKGKSKGKIEDKQNSTKGKGKGKPFKGKTREKGKGKKQRQRQSMISTCPQAQKAPHERFQIKDHASSWFGRKTLMRETWRLSMRERRSLTSSRTSVVRRFKEIMKDASVRDWKNMAHVSNPRQSVHVYDHESKSVRNPGPEIE